jgi:hypothetical protein
MTETGVASVLVLAAAERMVDTDGVTDSDVAVLLGKAGAGVPFRAIVDVRKWLKSQVREWTGDVCAMLVCCLEDESDGCCAIVRLLSWSCP